jgi:uncharacterized damage-inducible protein DinB
MNSRLVDFAEHYWSEYLGKIATAIELLTDEQIWWRPNEASNSIGNLLAHLAGNLGQWILVALGGEAFARDRDAEFAARGGATKAELLARLRATVDGCHAVARRLKPQDLARRHVIQKHDVDGFRAIFHAVEHMSYHTGQIVLLAKMQGARVDFYPKLAAEPPAPTAPPSDR